MSSFRASSRRTATHLLAVALLAACGGREEGTRDSSTTAAGSPFHDTGARGKTTTNGEVNGVSGACLLAALWSPCLLRKALENAGLAPQEEDSVHYPFLKTGGRRWRLGRAELQTFIYPSAEVLQADLAAIDTVTGQPKSGRDRVEWSRPPATIVSRNLLAFLLGGTERHDERIRNALEAGVLGLKPR